MNRSKMLFEKQYKEKKLTYKESFPKLRKILRKYLNTRDDVVKKILEEVNGGNYLDYGCGDGSLLFELGSSYDECCGYDIASSRLQKARDYVRNNMRSFENKYKFIEVDPDCRIEIQNDYFDVVTCVAVFPWVYDIYFLGKELHRVLKPGGVLVSEVANYAYFKRRIKLLLGRLPSITPTSITDWPEIGWDAGCLHYFTKGDLIEFIKQCGFKVEKVKPTGFLANLLKIFPGMFATGWVVLAKKEKQ